jgi:hypothetical protein
LQFIFGKPRNIIEHLSFGAQHNPPLEVALTIMVKKDLTVTRWNKTGKDASVILALFCLMVASNACTNRYQSLGLEDD